MFGVYLRFPSWESGKRTATYIAPICIAWGKNDSAVPHSSTMLCMCTYTFYTHTFTHTCTAGVSGPDKKSPRLVPFVDHLSFMMLLQQSEMFKTHCI